MKILIISQHFWPEEFLINSLVVNLQSKNVEVTVLTGFPNYPHGDFLKIIVATNGKRIFS